MPPATHRRARSESERYFRLGILSLLDNVDFQLRFRYLRPAWEECNEILIFHQRLLEVAFRVPRVGDGELRTSYVIRIRVACDKPFKQGPRIGILGLLHGLY